MLSILKFSGSHWSRAAIVWLLFAFAIEGLAEAGAESADAKIAAFNAAVALGVLNVAERSREQGVHQVAKVEVVELDLNRFDPAQFGDQDHGAPAGSR